MRSNILKMALGAPVVSPAAPPAVSLRGAKNELPAQAGPRGADPAPWNAEGRQEDPIEWVNRNYFIAEVNGKASIFREYIDGEGYPRVASLTRAEFALALEPYSVLVSRGGGAVLVPLASAWLRDARRRTYARLELVPDGKPDPTTYYLFKGFAIDPQQGDASRVIEHIDMICSHNEAVREYVLSWLAHLVQRPGVRPETCVVMPGPEGAGKGTIARVLKAIFGPYFLHLSNPRHLTGNFNAHLMTAVVVFVDEGYWSGDKAAEGVFKALVTEDHVLIEPKGREAFQMPNRMAFMVATNNEYAAPASARARRWMVIPVNDERVGDHAYFSALHEDIENGGAAAFLHYLLNRDISGFNPRDMPQTQALNQQKLHHMGVLDRWLMNALETGTGLAGGEWEGPQVASCAGAVEHFGRYAQSVGMRAYGTDTRTIGKRLNEVFKCGPAEARVGDGYSRGRGWRLPALEDARATAAREFGLHQYEWGRSA